MAPVVLGPVLPEFLSLGLLGVGLVSWLGEDSSDGEDVEGDTAEDEFDMDDEFGMEEDFDVDGFDEMDDMDGGDGGASTSELENRIEDLESEIADVSSTANTVRSENEQISEKVDEVEENVRKLLEIYEMVTRGVNPFVDDVSPDAGMESSGDFGLFGDEGDDTEETEDDLESDISDADAEDFFEDDAFDEDFDDGDFDGEDLEEEDPIGDEDFEEGADSSDGDDLEMDEEFSEEAFDDSGDFGDESLGDMEETDEPAMNEDTDDSTEDAGGMSFDELKAEYESGEADWADEDFEGTEVEEEPTESAETEPTSDPETEDLFQQDDLADSAEDPTDAAEESAATPAAESPDPDTDTGSIESTPGEATTGESAPEHASTGSEQAAPESEPGDAEGDFQFGAAAAADATTQPHLTEPPAGYLSDVLLMEWLDFLVSEFDTRNAIRALNHYEQIGWIGEPMRDHCLDVLQGIADEEFPYRDESGPTELAMEDHRRSLRYIEDLGSDHLDRALGERISTVEDDGLRR
ncbi:MAG: FlaD/FlaE family flagellar protein [Halodesulfurarchaeum sp.]